MKLLIKVSKKCIKRGVYCDPAECPVARAIRKHNRMGSATVDGHYVFVRSKCVATLPKKAREWIVSFDRNQKPDPIEFNLTVTL